MELSGKLQIKPGQSISVLNSPPGLVMPLQSSGEDAVARADVVIGFVVRRDDLGTVDPVLAAARADRLAWLAYPKGGQLGTDLNRDSLVRSVSGHGVQPVRQVSIDATWSALRLRPSPA